MNLARAVVIAVSLLFVGCAATDTDRADRSTGAASAGTERASPGTRTRAEVHAEAVERVKHYKSTQSEERDYFNPYAQHE